VKITVNKESEIPIRDQLIEQIGLQIASGTLKGKEKLPSIRALADRLGIHYSTVTAAYNHLADVGLLEVRQGSGVRVCGRPPSDGASESTIDEMVREFLAQITETKCSRDDLVKRLEVLMKPRPVRRIVAVDRNEDFHEILRCELKPHFSLPIETMTVDGFKQNSKVVADSLIITSLYHLASFETAVSDPTRLIVCNIQPANTELNTVSELPPGSLVALISGSPTIMRMATKLLGAGRSDVGVRSILVTERSEIEYVMKHADLVLCDSSSENVVVPMSGKKRVVVFKLYSPNTIQLIKDRLEKWG
jgi:GntR family transcriptional regulator